MPNKFPSIHNSLPQINLARSAPYTAGPESWQNLDRTLPLPQVNTTYLPPDQEASYRQWLSAIGQTPGSGYNIDRNWNGTDYDYRGFFQKYGPVDIRHGQHFTDEFKLPNHPTFSNESVYATGPAADFAGSWSDGDVYTPSPTQAVRGKRKYRE